MTTDFRWYTSYNNYRKYPKERKMNLRPTKQEWKKKRDQELQNFVKKYIEQELERDEPFLSNNALEIHQQAEYAYLPTPSKLLYADFKEWAKTQINPEISPMLRMEIDTIHLSILADAFLTAFSDIVGYETCEPINSVSKRREITSVRAWPGVIFKTNGPNTHRNLKRARHPTETGWERGKRRELAQQRAQKEGRRNRSKDLFPLHPSKEEILTVVKSFFQERVEFGEGEILADELYFSIKEFARQNPEKKSQEIAKALESWKVMGAAVKEVILTLHNIPEELQRADPDPFNNKKRSASLIHLPYKEKRYFPPDYEGDKKRNRVRRRGKEDTSVATNRTGRQWAKAMESEAQRRERKRKEKLQKPDPSFDLSRVYVSGTKRTCWIGMSLIASEYQPSETGETHESQRR